MQIPGSDFTDNRTLRSSPQDLWDVYTETFDYLREKEAPALLAISMHCHFGGRPLIAAVYEKIFDHMKRYQDVWFASFGEVARWVMDTQRDADTHARRLIANMRRPMPLKSTPKQRAEVITACRVLTHFRIAEGFGHVSTRVGKDRILITPRRALGLTSKVDLVELELDGNSARAPPIRRSKWRCISRSTAAALT